MKEYLPYSRICRRIAVLRYPSAYKPDNPPLNDEVAVQGVIAQYFHGALAVINVLFVRILRFIFRDLYPQRQI
jgi:hypothetical protein